MDAAAEVDKWSRPLVLVVEPDRQDRDRLRAWLEGAGVDVMWCPGPTAPEYTCVGGRGGPCPLAEAADVILLDLDLDGEAVAVGTTDSELLSYYTGLGKPVLVFGPDTRVARAFAESGVRPIEFPVQREELIRAVTGAFVNARIARPRQEIAVASEFTSDPVAIDPGFGGIDVARRWVERIEEGDVGGALTLYSPKARLHVGRETFEGPDAIRAHLQGTPLPGMHPWNMESGGEDQTALARWEPNVGTPGGHTRIMIADGEIVEQWLVLRADEEDRPARVI